MLPSPKTRGFKRLVAGIVPRRFQRPESESAGKGKKEGEEREQLADVSTPSPPAPSRARNMWVGIGTGLVTLLCLLVAWWVIGAPGKQQLQQLVLPREGSSTVGSLRPPKFYTPPPRQTRAESPLSGIFCEQYRRRPIAVMLGSDPITRPVSGLREADMVFEMPVLVNGITRLMAVYQCGAPKEIGSVRSARHDFLFLAKGVDAVIAHWGGSYHALNRIRIERLIESIDALRNPFRAYWRKSNLPAPYNGYTSYEKLWNALVQLGYRQETKLKPYTHRNDVPREQRPAGGVLTIGWPGSMQVRYEYNPETNTYQRYWGTSGQPQIDGADGQPVAPKVVIVMRAAQRLVKPGEPYNDVDVEGEGELLVYQNGREIRGRWKKSIIHKQDPLHFLDEQGRNIPLVRGQVWVEIVEPERTVNWQVQETAV
jgi:hypothetical protein